MGLVFKCFFCGRSVVAQGEEKYVNCPKCGARIDVDSDLGVPEHTAIQGKGCLFGCVAIAITMFITSIIFFTLFRANGEKITKSCSIAKNAPKHQHKNPGLYATVAVIASAKIQEQRIQKKKCFDFAQSQKEDFRRFHPALRRLFAQQRLSYYRNYARVKNNLMRQVYGSCIKKVKKTFLNQRLNARSRFNKGAALINLALKKELQKRRQQFAVFRKRNAIGLSYAMLLELRNKTFPAALPLKDVILRTSIFKEFRKLLLPEALASLYWDWSIGVHYGITNMICGQISIKAKQLILWEKVPLLSIVNGQKKYYHWVIFSNGATERWQSSKLKKTLGMIK